MGQRLLVVDSDRSFLKEHQVSLEAAFDVDVSPLPDGALAKLESGQYAAALICVEVAENKGYALCSAIRKSPKTATLKIALISAKATEEEYRRHQSLKGRADLYLHKPLASGALVAALSQVVPPRSVDPDNPLGDLTGELGEDWLDSLKDELDGAAAPSPESLPVTHQTVAISMDMLKKAVLTPPAVSPKASTSPIPVLPIDPAPQARTVAISMEQLRESFSKPPEAAPEGPDRAPGLEARIQELEAQVSTKAASLELAEAEIERLSTELELSRKAEATATKNLDESERLKADLDQLHARVKDREEALQRTREDYEALQRSHDSITQNLDELERRQKESEELRGKLAQAEAALARLEQSSVREGEGSEALKAQLRQAIEEHHDLLQQVEQLNNQMADKNQRVIGLMKERDRLQQQALEAENQQKRVAELEHQRQQLDGSLGDLSSRHEELEKVHQELAVRYAETCTRGEEQTSRIQTLERDRAGLESRLKSQEAEADGLRARIAELEGSLKAQEEAVAEHQAGKDKLLAVAADLERQLGRMVGQHEAERIELMQGLDNKEAELGRIQAALEGAKQTIAGKEDEVKSLQSALADRTDRLGALAALLGELGEKIQRGADLTKA